MLLIVDYSELLNLNVGFILLSLWTAVCFPFLNCHYHYHCITNDSCWSLQLITFICVGSWFFTCFIVPVDSVWDQKSLPFLSQMVQFPCSVGGPHFKGQLDKKQNKKQVVGNHVFDTKPSDISRQPQKAGGEAVE